MKHTKPRPPWHCGQAMKKVHWRGRRFNRKSSLRKLVRLKGRISKRQRLFFFWRCKSCKLEVKR